MQPRDSLPLEPHNLQDPPVLKFEDGTIPFLSILALKEGFNTIKRLNLSFELISKHTFLLAQYVYRNLLCLHHSNGRPAVILYHNTTFEDSLHQGSIINFNVLRDNGEYVGYSEVLHFANLYDIHLRTGCFCNPGACQHFLKLSPEDVKRQFDAGHVCGDQHDLVDGYPTGSVRISFGYMSTKADADKLIEMVENCFVSEPVVKKIPQSYEQYKSLFTIARDNILTNKQHCNEGVLEQIVLYPIKSCGGFSVFTKWPITSTGLKYDRQWMVINSSGVCVTQKNNRNMCLIRPKIDLITKKLTLTYPDHEDITIPVSPGSNSKNSASLCQSKVCGDKIEGWDCGDDIADWLAQALNSPGLRLLRQVSDTEKIVSRTSKKNEQLQLSLANQAQYLVINTASVEWLRARVTQEDFTEPLQTTIQRFRPNFVVKFQEPFVENACEEFRFDNIKFEAGGVCTRCQMICIDQNTGKTSKEPLQTLSKAFKGKISFGMYLNRTKDASDEFLHVGRQVNGFKIS